MRQQPVAAEDALPTLTTAQATPGPYAEIRWQVAEQTGEDPDRIRLVEMQLDMLLKVGVVVDIDATGLSLFSVKAPWEMWGVPASSARRAHLTAGSLSLFPKSVVNGVRSKAQSAVNSLDAHYSFPVPGLPGRWVPYTAYRAWLEDFNHRVADLDRYVQQHILECYDVLVRQAERDVSRMAREAYNSLRALDRWIELDERIGVNTSDLGSATAALGDVVRVCGHWLDGRPDISQDDIAYRTFQAGSLEVVSADEARVETETCIVGAVTGAGSGLGTVTQDEFAEDVMVRVRRAIPTPEIISERLRLTYSTAALVNPAVVEAELAHRDEIRRMREIAQEAEGARREEKDRERRLAREQEEAQKRRIWAQARLVELEVEYRQKQLEEMRAVEREHYRQQLTHMASPVLAIFNNLRTQMHAGAQAVLETLKSGRANGPAVRKARGMVQAFRLLNGLEDDEMDRLIARADALVNQADELDTRALEDVMKEIVSLAAQASADMQIAAHRGGRWRGLRPAQA